MTVCKSYTAGIVGKGLQDLPLAPLVYFMTTAKIRYLWMGTINDFERYLEARSFKRGKFVVISR